MIIVENLLGKLEVLLDLGALGPRDRQEPIEVIAHYSGLRRHRRHLLEFFELVRGLFARLLRELGLLDLVVDRGEIVHAFRVANLFLDRLHLFVKKNIALGLLHLPLDAGADARLDLQYRNLAVDQGEQLLEPLGEYRGFQARAVGPTAMERPRRSGLTTTPLPCALRPARIIDGAQKKCPNRLRGPVGAFASG